MAEELFNSTMPADSGDRYFLERPRVDRLLAAALQSHVVTVVAGEGSGKTYAVNSFLRKDPRKTIWIQISQRDNLGWRFWENYTGEVARLNPEAAKILAGMGFPESSRQFDRYLTLIKNEIVTHERYVIVLDDFHLLTNPSILLFLERTLSAPVSKNVITLISRTEPAMNTVNFLSKGLLSQITVEDLRFSREEVDEYFRLHDVPLAEEELERICRETEGWPLALGLILQEIKADNSGVRSWDRVMLPIRKMEENIFEVMDRNLRKFLVKLSLIEHWPRNLLERLEPEGKNICAMENFTSVIRFDSYLHGFRIHQLFLDFLKEKQGELSREEIREVCGIDAQWCIENNLPTDAAVDYERAGDCGGLYRLIDSLPQMLPRAVASFFLGTVERLVGAGRQDEEDGDFLYLRFIVRSRLLAFLDRFDESARECRAAIARFEPRAPCPLRSRILAGAYNNLGILSILACKYTRDYNFARWFEKACRYYRENPEPAGGQLGQSNLGSYVIQIGVPAEPGEIETFAEAYAAAVPYASVSLSGYLYGADTLVRAELAYYQGDLIRAEQFARRAVYQSREKKQYEVENRALFYLMRIGIHTGDAAGIRELERQLEAQLEIPEYLNRYNIHDIIMGRFYTRIGLTGKIASWLRDEYEGELNVLFRGFDTLVKARCLFTEKDYAAALRALEEEKARGDLAGILLGKLEMLVLEAALRYHLGEEGALETLEEAYLLAAPNSLNMPFIELGENMRLLAGAALADEKSRIPRLWLENIRNRASAYGKQVSLIVEHYQAEAGEEQKPGVYLTRQERSVLSGVSRGLKRKDISVETGLSLNTVRVIISAIYGKLGAVNRADAIRIATAKGLLPGGGKERKKRFV
ncbi:MAG: LuxR C-terminal-related transcriptional regulator [Spirochaetales bacterium]|nr:LuxR C-terminal-related transcriptional regulator [Spirochaetales bacterium]